MSYRSEFYNSFQDRNAYLTALDGASIDADISAFADSSLNE